MTAAILSLSLLTVMAGAAIAPALDVIRAHFADSSALMVQMIISTPALFIVLTSLIFPRLCRRFGSKGLVLVSLILYTLGGCGAGAVHSIGAVLVLRAFVGVGVGIMMPLSTGLLSFYFSSDRQAQLMGYSSAANQMGGVIATLLSGLLATVSWRAAFLVYLMGLLSIVLCLLFLPNGRIAAPAPSEKPPRAGHTLRTFFPAVLAMFLLMSAFFVYPANFALETAANGVLPQGWIAAVMAGADLVAFFGGLLFVHLRCALGRHTRYLAPLLFLAGYVLLVYPGGVTGTLAGSACIGFANGVGIPYLISESSLRAGKSAAATVMPLLSAALYLAQFLSPLLLSAVQALCGNIAHLPYWYAAVLALLFLLCSVFLPKEPSSPEAC